MPAINKSEVGKLNHLDQQEIDEIEGEINKRLVAEHRKQDPKPVIVRYKEMEDWAGHPLDYIVRIHIIADYESGGDWNVSRFTDPPNGDGIRIAK